MSKIAIIDAEIIGKSKHRFPNLVCMKLSGYYKTHGHTVELKTDYEHLEDYDRVFISKVFTSTVIPLEPEDKTNKNTDTICEWYADNEFLKQPNLTYGGTGFYYDKAPNLPHEIEHAFPDYHLYDIWMQAQIAKGVKASEFSYYTEYSIGYLTRGCFRQCSFCVNRKYNAAFVASPLKEFMDPSRPKLCFLDDNFFAYSFWRELIRPVKDSKKPFQFKQGLDERLLTAQHIHEIASWRYHGELIFAFDNIKDKPIIVDKLRLIYTLYPNWRKGLKFYVLCGYDPENKYDAAFWRQDIIDTFERIYTLSSYGALPYIMRYEAAYASEYSSFYTAVAAWCNQPRMFKSFTFSSLCRCRGMGADGYKKYKRNATAYLADGGAKGSSWRAMEAVGSMYPEIAARYFNIDVGPWFIKCQSAVKEKAQ